VLDPAANSRKENCLYVQIGKKNDEGIYINCTWLTNSAEAMQYGSKITITGLISGFHSHILTRCGVCLKWPSCSLYSTSYAHSEKFTATKHISPL
jgi:hypothetical protein